MSAQDRRNEGEGTEGAKRPIWVELGEGIFDAGQTMTNETWWVWAYRVAEEVEERGAWFLLGSRPDGDEFVIDVLDHMGRELPVVSLASVLRSKLKNRNVRTVRFFARPISGQ